MGNKPLDDLRRRDRRLILWTGWTCLWLAPMLTFLLVAVAEWTGWDSDRDHRAATGGVIIAVLTGILAAVGVLRVQKIRRTPIMVLVMAEPRATQPVRGDRRRPRRSGAASSARTPMARLDRAEARLDDLLRQLDASEIPTDWVNRARIAGDVAAHELRTVAAKLDSVEQALVSAPSAERAKLRAGVNRLREQLDDGLDGYGRLIAAAGQTLIASTAMASASELTDATDHLAGLSEALRDIQTPTQRG